METNLENFRPNVDEKESEIAVVTNPNNETTEADQKDTEDVTKVDVEKETTIDEFDKSLSKEQTKRMTIRICKIGSDHIFANINNQDYAFALQNMKVVTDGCSKYKHSEVGSKLFSQLFALKTKEYLDKGESICEENFIDVVNSIFEKMIGLCNDDCFLIRNYCFTILVCFEFEDEFVIYSCGDGYIIKEDKEGISFERLSDGDYPCYYIYNYIEDKSEFEAHKEEKMIFKVTRFSKSEYCNVGIASDGLRYVEDLPKTEKVKDNFFDFMEFLRKGASIPIERFINRWNDKNGKFHDDISIVF